MSDNEDEVSKASDDEAADDESTAGLEDDDENKEGQQEVIVEVPMTREHLATCLTMLCKTGDGLAHALVKLDASNRELTDINILQTFKHLRYVKLSKNALKKLSPLKNNKHMIMLDADDNEISEVELHDLQYIQLINLNNNQLTSCESLSHPQLSVLSLRNNKITSLEELACERLSNLHTLELRGNQIVSLSGLCLPHLQYLYLADNKIKRLDKMEDLVSLRVIHLRGNPLEFLTGLSENNKNLQQINLRSTAVKNVNELRRLYKLPALQILTLMESPVAEEETYKAEALIYAPHLQRLDKDVLGDEEKQEAASIRAERIKDNTLEFDDKEEMDQEEGVEETEEEMNEEGDAIDDNVTGDEKSAKGSDENEEDTEAED